jgi:hypothetical protein
MLRVELARDKRDQPWAAPAESPPRVLELPAGTFGPAVPLLPPGGGEVVKAAQELALGGRREIEHLLQRPRRMRILAALDMPLGTPDRRLHPRGARRPLLAL